MKNKSFAINNKAQEFEVFRFLIAAIMGLAILTIIISIIGNLDELKKEVNMSDFYAKLDSAVEGAGLDEKLISKGVLFTKGDVFTDIAIKERYTNIDAVYFDGNPTCFSIEVGKITAKKDCKVDVYIWCNSIIRQKDNSEIGQEDKMSAKNLKKDKDIEDKLECYLNLGIKPLETKGN